MNRSEELCKLLGIVPKITYIMNGIVTKFDNNDGCSICYTKLQLIDCLKISRENNDCLKYEKGEYKTIKCKVDTTYVKYPDLTKPSNFVKLYEISHKACKEGEVILLYNGESAVDSLIEQLIRFEKKINTVKKLAQATKWDY